ncbi:MAG: amino acid ABC transporter permease [Marinovum algicola]|uniref:amino acid ABC transporter permease n=1 Tax=Roseobacteraceae TaxID=2854170 RepID=UPI0032EBBC6B
MVYEWDFSTVLANPGFWFSGVLVTFAYGFSTIAGGMIIGVLLGVASLSKSRFVTIPIDAYVQVFRCTPLLVQIVWFYYALPIVLAVDLPAWLAAGAGLTLYMGAFCVEIFRGGIISIDKGQWQAARAIGMREIDVMRHVILPQAARRMIAPFINQSVIQMKNTALLYVVAVPDLMYRSTIIVAETFRPLEAYTLVAVIYFVILYPLVKFAQLLERRTDV